MVNKLGFWIITVLTFIGCSNHKGRTIENDEVSVEKTEPINIDSLLLANAVNDTVVVNGKSIVFFSISQPEYDAYPKGPNSGIEEVISDFNYYSNNAADTLTNLGFNLTMTASRFVKIMLENDSVFLFDRLNPREHVVGRIYSNSRQITVSYGVATDLDILNELNDPDLLQ